MNARNHRFTEPTELATGSTYSGPCRGCDGTGEVHLEWVDGSESDEDCDVCCGSGVSPLICLSCDNPVPTSGYCAPCDTVHTDVAGGFAEVEQLGRGSVLV